MARGLTPFLTRLAQLNENDKPVLIYSTYPSAAEAERIGATLVDRGLAACVNILPGMTAIYIWQGKRQRDTEARKPCWHRHCGGAQAAPLHQPRLRSAAHRRRLGGLPALDRRADGAADVTCVVSRPRNR